MRTTRIEELMVRGMSAYTAAEVAQLPDVLINFAGEPERIWNTQSEDLGECEASRGIDIQSAAITKKAVKQI